MSFWSRIYDFVSGASGNAFAGVIEAVRTLFEGDPETRRQVAFSIAMIALSAKMAKADGVVTAEEVDAFQDIFDFPDEETKNVERLYNLAKEDIAGYEGYARQLAGMCGSGEPNCPMLEDILDGLFHIAKADGVIHDAERDYLHNVAGIFGIEDSHFETILARHADFGHLDPYRVLGVERDADFAAIRKRYRELVAENHPDRLIARGVPAEFVAIATERMAKLNAAFDLIEKMQRAAAEKAEQA